MKRRSTPMDNCDTQYSNELADKMIEALTLLLIVTKALTKDEPILADKLDSLSSLVLWEIENVRSARLSRPA